MNYLLHTCVLSEFRKKVPEPKVLAWVGSQREESLFLSVMTIGEIQKGVSRLPRSKRRNELSLWLDGIVIRYDERVLPLDTEVMRSWGNICSKLELKARVLPAADSLIAATAAYYDMVVVTHNEADFKDAGINVLNAWK